jgi:hypothetical protein
LKVSQFVGLMGDTPLTPEEAALNASMARCHVQHLAERFSGGEHK